MKNKRQDFNNAIKCLRNAECFVEGSSVDDANASFILAYLPGRASHGGQNKQKKK